MFDWRLVLIGILGLCGAFFVFSTALLTGVVFRDFESHMPTQEIAEKFNQATAQQQELLTVSVESCLSKYGNTRPPDLVSRMTHEIIRNSIEALGDSNGQNATAGSLSARDILALYQYELINLSHREMIRVAAFLKKVTRNKDDMSNLGLCSLRTWLNQVNQTEMEASQGAQADIGQSQAYRSAY